jgi:uncharacterized membrane protein
MFAFGTVALLVTLVVDQHRNVGLFSLLGGLSWGILALRAGNLDVLKATDAAVETVTVSTPELQLFSLAAALASLVTFYGAVSGRVDSPRSDTR